MLAEELHALVTSPRVTTEGSEVFLRRQLTLLIKCGFERSSNKRVLVSATFMFPHQNYVLQLTSLSPARAEVHVLE